MLTVKTPEEVFSVLEAHFTWRSEAETVSLEDAPGRVLADSVRSEAYVPDFDRSTVDGYAVKARDTFGCSDSIPDTLLRPFSLPGCLSAR